ncbi:MAG TPA: BMP family protein [Virgibacillus sp.]|nr:BMP family protein [Virgibacillus sp.]
MKNRKYSLFVVLVLSVALFLAACGSSDDAKSDDKDNAEDASDYSVGLVTDVGGVDDKSFNQSSWEGLQEWGEEHGLEEKEGYEYAQSDDESDYLPNLNRFVRNDFNLIFGIGFMLEDGINTIAEQHPDANFAIVDSVVDQPNVVSINFADHEGSFLVGVAAALKTETDKVGFIGGVDSETINKFEAGFVAGVKSIDSSIDVDVQYAGAFDAADDGKLIASNMYNNDVDIIYHSAGGTGNGVFAQAKDIKHNDPDRDVWVIGVDRDQYDEGVIDDHNITLTSMLKRVDVAVQEVSNMGMEGEFPAGETLEFSIEDDGIGISLKNEDALTDDIVDAIDEWKEKIVNGDVDVPGNHEELEEFEESL